MTNLMKELTCDCFQCDIQHGDLMNANVNTGATPGAQELPQLDANCASAFEQFLTQINANPLVDLGQINIGNNSSVMKQDENKPIVYYENSPQPATKIRSTSLSSNESNEGNKGSDLSKSDPKYWERRRKNNLAAKKSRDARRIRENQLKVKVLCLENANHALKIQVKEEQEMNKLLRKQLADYEQNQSSNNPS